MIRIGILSYTGTGHLNPMIALSRELASRGHEVTLFLPPEFEKTARANNLSFAPILLPVETDCSTARVRPYGASSWSQNIRARVNRIDHEIGGFLAQYASAIKQAGVDALIMDEIIFAGPTVAELLGLPYVVLSTSIPHNFGWNNDSASAAVSSWQARLERQILEVSIFRMRGPIRFCLDRHRRHMGLSAVRANTQRDSNLAHITQWPQCLDFRRFDLPRNFHYTGPFATSRRIEQMAFPWSQLDGRPLVYASLGTTRTADASLFYRIAEACAGLDVQLVVTLGGRRDPASFSGLPGDPILVQTAPQLDLLDKAEVVITHAGPNTVLETLLRGKPMIALPLTLDQPAVAERLSRAGAAEVLPLERRSAEDILAALSTVLSTPTYRESAIALQKQLTALRGVSHAADIVESVFVQTPFEARGCRRSIAPPPVCLAQ